MIPQTNSHTRKISKQVIEPTQGNGWFKYHTSTCNLLVITSTCTIDTYFLNYQQIDNIYNIRSIF